MGVEILKVFVLVIEVAYERHHKDRICSKLDVDLYFISEKRAIRSFLSSA